MQYVLLHQEAASIWIGLSNNTHTQLSAAKARDGKMWHVEFCKAVQSCLIFNTDSSHINNVSMQCSLMILVA